jgi:hypothetical protein
MGTAVPLAVDVAIDLSLVSLGTFVTACMRLIQDRSAAARHAPRAARAGTSQAVHTDRWGQLSLLLNGFTSREE